jgi:hypothetical protein
MQSLNKLYNEFLKIKKMGWIKSKRKGTTGIGYTFETLLGKKEENFSIPDFNEIEIKTMKKYGKGNIKLFNLTPDGDYLYPIERIIKKLGYPDKEYPEYKVINTKTNAIEYTKIGYYKKIILEVDRKNEKISLKGINNEGINKNIDVSWSFKSLEERINIKLTYLAIIKAEYKIINNEEYFYYNQIKFYELKDFETFINLIEDGTINLTINIGIFKTEDKLGKMHNHGIGFSIEEKNIEKLYRKI